MHQAVLLPSPLSEAELRHVPDTPHPHRSTRLGWPVPPVGLRVVTRCRCCHRCYRVLHCITDSHTQLSPSHLSSQPSVPFAPAIACSPTISFTHPFCIPRHSSSTPASPSSSSLPLPILHVLRSPSPLPFPCSGVSRSHRGCPVPALSRFDSLQSLLEGSPLHASVRTCRPSKAAYRAARRITARRTRRRGRGIERPRAQAGCR